MNAKLSLTLTLALCTMMGALGIDTYLPSFHAIGQEFDVGPAAVQQTLSAYVLAMAITMLFYGTLSDTFGRRRILILSAIGYAITSAMAAAVQSIEALVAVRVAQGAMAGAGMVIVRAIVQDRFRGAEAQRMMSLVMFCFGLAPAIAPVFGGWLQTHGGWRAAFIFLSCFGLLLASMCWRALPETHPIDQRTPLHLGVVLRNYLQALGDPQLRFMVAGVALMSGANALYISGAAEFVMSVLKLPATAFGWLFIPLIGGSMAGSALSSILARRVAQSTQLRMGGGCLMLGCTSNVVYQALTDAPVVPWAVLPITCYAMGIALLMPIFSLRIMDLFPHMRGLVSSLQGFSQMSIFALVAGVVVPQLFHSGLAMALGQALFAVLGMLLWLRARHLRNTGNVAHAVK